MSWTDWAAPASSGSRRAAVTVGCTAALGRFRQRLIIVLRPERFLSAPAWLCPGAPVRVQTGGGEHAGQVRVVPARTGIVIGKGGGRGALPTLSLPGFPGLPAEAHRGEPVEHDYGDDWLELTLPAWARAAAPQPPPPTPAKPLVKPRIDMTKHYEGRLG